MTDTYDRPSRAEAAIALKVSGATYHQIARTLEYANAAQARTAVEMALAATVTEADRTQQREIAARRIERLMLSLWGKATDEKNEEHLSAVRTALALTDRHIRLFGLDAPQQMVVYTPAGEEIAEWVAGMAEQVRGELPAEADIITGSVVPDEESA
jgi:hypothetical protein